MLIHFFRGPGRVFGFTKDATGANLPPEFSPGSAFKSIDLSRDGEPRPGVETNEIVMPMSSYRPGGMEGDLRSAWAQICSAKFRAAS